MGLHLESGIWVSDDNCSSGCNQEPLAYCHKLYPATEQTVALAPVPADTKPFETAGCSSTIVRAAQKQVVCCAPVTNLN